MTKVYKRCSVFLKTISYPSIKGLLFIFFRKGGRNFTKKICSYSKRGGVQRKFRMLDFKRFLWNLPALVLRIEKDPFRNSLISLICYTNGILSYTLAGHRTKVGKSTIASDKFSYFRNGNTLVLGCIPEGTLIYNVELFPGLGGSLARSAGTSMLLMRKFESKILLRLPSREEIMLGYRCMASVGMVSNADLKYVPYFKAGQKRLLGFRPKVRGVARNPVDHPHGGGGGRCQVTYWSKVAKNYPTKNYFKPSITEVVINRKNVRRRKK